MARWDISPSTIVCATACHRRPKDQAKTPANTARQGSRKRMVTLFPVLLTSRARSTGEGGDDAQFARKPA